MGNCCGLSPQYNYERLPLHNQLQDNYNRKQPSQHTLRERALLNARFFLRSHASLSLYQQLPQIGTRKDKHWFRVKDERNQQLLMEMIPAGDKSTFRIDSENSRYALSQVVCGMRSHFVYPTIQADVVAEKGILLVVREICDKGSLRDLLYSSKWNQDLERKYRDRGRPFSDTRIATWSRHILEGINYLALKGLPPGHVHTGNIIVHHNVCRITGYENALLNLKPRALPLMLSSVAKRRQLDPNVVCFGAVLFEMATGYEMDKVDLEQPPRGLHPAIEDALGLIFYDNQSGPTVEELLDLPIFRDVEMPDLPPVRKIKLGNRAMEMLRKAREGSLVVTGGRATRKKKKRPAKRYQDSVLSTTNYERRQVQGVVSPRTTSTTTTTTTTTAAPGDTSTSSSASTSTTATTTTSTSSSKPKAKPKKKATSSSTAAKKSSGAPVAPKAPAPPTRAPAKKAAAPPPANAQRNNLLSSIQGFGKGALKKTVTVDKSVLGYGK